MNQLTVQPFPVLVQKFFMQRLQEQRHVSPRTVMAYRDSFRLLLAFAYQRLHKRPAEITIQDLGAPFVLEFLRHLEQDRRNAIRSRNARFAAIRSFMEYVSLEEPSALAVAQSVLAIPMKRFEQPIVGFVSRQHIEAILAAPNTSTWTGQRDHIMLATLYNTGARVSELLEMRGSDLVFGPTSWVRIHGKGRKERSVPLWPDTAKELRHWMRQYPRDLHEPLFPGRSGDSLTRVGFTERLKLAVQTASRQFPELAKNRISPHVIRHYIPFRIMSGNCGMTRF
ncbi:tyrosine-type recombinase/integrase [Caballeronia glebae]|uniref:tyrosine-type recombinase/integrase n=1 Tax=Caballeronia glebae TaxID=1777143 RepID=UPI0038BDA3EA